MKKVPESQVFALKAHNAQKNQDAIERVNKAIDKLKKKNATINFETVEGCRRFQSYTLQ